MSNEAEAEIKRLVAKIEQACGMRAVGQLARYSALALAEAHVLAAKALAPADIGQLANSIHSTAFKQAGLKAEATCATSTEYAAYVEFGTGEPGAKGFAALAEKPPITVTYSSPPYLIKRSRNGSTELVEANYWVYKGKRGFVATQGHAPRPFMWPSALRIKKQAPDIILACCENILAGLKR